ncbi:MAG TPA: AAA family ATPase [Elusimicrobia bacterium]|nr:AAA family ATPase [Elusimicrobiota bacterium]
MEQIEINDQFKKAINLVENTNKNIFITGKAGTGKSTLLNYFRLITKKKIVVLAPTGVAALNVNGETIHSFFGFKPDITLDKIKKLNDKNSKMYKEIEILVIDEISMVRADLLDCIDKFMRTNGKHSKLPFGGTQMLFFGDLYQLPPVVTSKEKEIFKNTYQSAYFFDAKVFNDLSMEFIELEKIYRQKDEKFIEILNLIRNNSITEKELTTLNKRFGATFSENIKSNYEIQLTTTNKMANETNMLQLQTLKTKIYSFNAEISGDFEENMYPTEYELQFGIDAQVMMLNNDSKERWVNGSIGKIIDIKHNKKNKITNIYVKLANGKEEEVLPHTWEIFHFSYNTNTNIIETDTVGTYTQYPMKLAWAVTIHKSQGKTFDKVIIDLGNGTFAHGQTYVALSRCTTFEGIILKRPIRKKDILMDWRIVKFITKYQYNLSERDMSLKEKLQIIQNAIKEKSLLEILYLKTNDEKTCRIIKPRFVGDLEYNDKTFLGINAYCMKRKEDRVFRVDRILEIKVTNGLE